MKFFKFKSTEMRIAEHTLKKINQLEESVAKLTDEELKHKTIEFRERIKLGETQDDIRPEVFAVSREATKRILGKRPYDVQMIGGIILDLGSVAEMKTGEGKTITSIAPVYLNALGGNSVIVSTVNEYLAERDAEEMGQVFKFLGLTVGINKAQMHTNLKREAYACDVVYSVHSELGFDYLRDNMVMSKEEKVQRGLDYILLDEVDSILIDEAKTPLIISGGDQEESTMYTIADLFVRTLNHDDYFIDEESKSVYLTDQGIEKANKYFNFKNLYDLENSELVHRIQNSLRAHKVMKLDVEYIVRNDKIELVDSFTGRIMEGRAYSEGLQQAIQAKERVEVESETKTLATITYQNFFRLFKKISGMTGTAKTEEKEFIDIYNMRVNVVPTNKPVVRIDDKDEIYVDMHSKWQAVTKEVKRAYQRKQPILIGTAQVEDSEILHEYLLQEGIPHTVLNAKQDASEAEIISKAGQAGAVTIATNMAGRGTDIKPTKEAIENGGLYVLGTEKAESRRIDNQLKGRSGRQGDIGYTKFFLSLDDQLILRFSVQDKWKEIFKEYGSDPIPGESIRSAFLRAQKKIEGFNYDSRKSVLNFDDVIRQQRDLIYEQRDLILQRDDLGSIIHKMFQVAVKQIVNNPYFVQKNDTLDFENFSNYLNKNFMLLTQHKFTNDEIRKMDKEELINYIFSIWKKEYDTLRQNIVGKYGLTSLVKSERSIILNVFDSGWQDHINIMDKLRRSTHLVQYAQKNPYQIYTTLGSKKFKELTDRIAMECSINLLNNYEGLPSSNSQIDFPWLVNNNDFKNNEESLETANQFINFLLDSERKHLISEGKNEEEVEEILKTKKQEVLKEFKIKLENLLGLKENQ
ncbi:preprotein translocase subunit SecA [Mycoplasmopsis arginini]|uniref:Protein translocase subunit SecA n=1 Tax=Mycoplasmopsis arginini TaxID=2094 RepID=A0AA43QXG4_MYCAR|nr:preprotein translocase subunit SecA [Mycoplasmopsis arginini]MCY2903029.1 preprotein translocase subunit SecA [Mycoplasmopsis arginini QMP CG1-2758]MDI3349739.1 preprotein translocase subunit SecA [Mycoplasmopsis arginini]MDI3350393.1 preprotein translocase subunit SecA [Mycoplasmopsis arginini]MDI3350786.1 preprotein translocase subunit SecA [Mycoplasmopsis arginini]MDI3351453.1 preprotein translocase subunit SecA [Mycoplasmopsis arginini]